MIVDKRVGKNVNRQGRIPFIQGEIKMDGYLIDYLSSGKAWVLIGSGPSNAMGYPTWEQLSSLTIKVEILPRRFTQPPTTKAVTP